MTNFKRLFVFNEKNEISGREAEWWASPKSKKIGVIIELDNDVLKIYSKFGRSPYYEELVKIFHVFIDEYKKTYGEIHTFDRKCNYRFIQRTGDSGCADVYLEINDSADGFPRRKKIMHISMYGKVNEVVSCFVYDFLDLFVGVNHFSIKNNNEGGSCICDPDPDPDPEGETEEDVTFSSEEDEESGERPPDDMGMGIRVIYPRFPEKESGWLQPGQYGRPVYMNEAGVIVK